MSDILETARGKSERDKIAVFLWPVSSASLQDCRLGPFLWFLLLVSLCKCHRAVIRRRSEWCSNSTLFFHMQRDTLTESKYAWILLCFWLFPSSKTGIWGCAPGEGKRVYGKAMERDLAPSVPKSLLTAPRLVCILLPSVTIDAQGCS